MRRTVKKYRWLLIYLTISLFFSAAIPARSLAYVIPSIKGFDLKEYNRVKDLAIIQKELESKIISQRLKDLGFTPEEIKERLAKLSDAEIHSIVSQIEAVKAGGDGTGVLVGVILGIILILLIFQVTGRRIVIE